MPFVYFVLTFFHDCTLFEICVRNCWNFFFENQNENQIPQVEKLTIEVLLWIFFFNLNLKNKRYANPDLDNPWLHQSLTVEPQWASCIDAVLIWMAKKGVFYIVPEDMFAFGLANYQTEERLIRSKFNNEL